MKRNESERAKRLSSFVGAAASSVKGKGGDFFQPVERADAIRASSRKDAHTGGTEAEKNTTRP